MKTTLISIILLILVSCGSNKTVNTETKEDSTGEIVKLSNEQAQKAGIVLGNPKMQSITTILKVNGKIDVPPQNMVSVSVPLGGYLKSTQLLPGMKVKKGEVIANIEDQQYVQLQQDYLSARARLSYTEKEYKRQKELNADKASSDKLFQQAEADYLTQKILTRSLSEKLRLISLDPEQLNENNISRSINVYAPINGYVSKINVNIGKYVNPADVVFELVNPTDIHLALTVFEKDIDKLFIGQKLMAYTNNKPDIKHKCEVLLIGQNLTAERSIEVHCHFEDYDNTLIPGMYMNAEIEVQAKDALVVPEEAIVHFGNGDFVFVEKEKNLFVLSPVKPGITEHGYTELLNGNSLIKSNIVIKGAYSLLMALKNKQEE